MLISMNGLYGDKLGASDGEIGHVRDFYFDDLSWAIRYVVADTGKWLAGRLVLLPPFLFGHLVGEGKVLSVSLTREQIEKSPSIETHKPVSRQYEELYFQYYGWPYYWEGGGLGVAAPFPVAGMMGGPVDVNLTMESGVKTLPEDAHLRSAKAVGGGYRLHTRDGIVGHVCDFALDPATWMIRHLIVKTGHRLTGREVQLDPRQVTRISYEDSEVYVNLLMAEVEKGAESDLTRVSIRRDSTLGANLFQESN